MASREGDYKRRCHLAGSPVIFPAKPGRDACVGGGAGLVLMGRTRNRIGDKAVVTCRNRGHSSSGRSDVFAGPDKVTVDFRFFISNTNSLVTVFLSGLQD